MKVTINTTEKPIFKEIDWNKKMLVVSKSGYHIFTTGCHDEINFEGMNIHNGDFGRWDKNHFTPCTTPVTITFENEL